MGGAMNPLKVLNIISLFCSHHKAPQTSVIWIHQPKTCRKQPERRARGSGGSCLEDVPSRCVCCRKKLKTIFRASGELMQSFCGRGQPPQHRTPHWESLLDDPVMPCCRKRFLRIWFLDFQSSTCETQMQVHKQQNHQVQLGFSWLGYILVQWQV